MGIWQHIGILLLPLDAVGDIAPESTAIDAVQLVFVAIEFHHARTAGKGAADFAEHTGIVKVRGHITIGCNDDAVGHQCVDRTEGRVLHIVLIYEAVAIGDPILAVGGAVANLSVVLLLSPSGISEAVPEG